MDDVPSELLQVAEQVKEGKTPSETTRTLLKWFRAQRRGYYVVKRIRGVLNELGVTTTPKFEYAYIDADLTFDKKETKEEEAKAPAGDEVPHALAAPSAEDGTVQEQVPAATGAFTDPTYRIGKLPAANHPPLTVKPDTSVNESISLMLLYNYSQLPVMTSEYNVKGMFSWKSLGSRVSLGKTCARVSDCMDDPVLISSETSIFDAVRIVAGADCVLIRDPRNNRITGLVTTTDLTEQFGQLGEPFLLLGEIENHVRSLLDGKFTVAQLRDVRDPSDSARQVDGVADLTFGEYVRLLENPDRWARVGLPVDRTVFTKALSEVRDLRNDVMHFDPDGVADEDLRKLRDFAEFLRRVSRLNASE